MHTRSRSACCSDRRKARRPARAPRDLHRRPRHLHRVVAVVRAGRRSRVAHRRAHRPGHRCRADEPGDPLDHHGDVPAASARDGDRHLGRYLCARARDRTDRRRRAHREDPLELDLLHQHSRRRRGGDRGATLHRRDERHVRRTTSRRAGAPHLGDRALRPDVWADRDERPRLDVDVRPRALRRRSRCAHGLRAARAATAPADARPLALPQPDVRRCERGDAARRSRDVRNLLLQLALPPEHPRLRRDQDGCDVPADDGADHPRRPGGGTILGSHRRSLADGRQA